MNNERWGIIYCPKRGIVQTHKRWDQIRQYLEARDVAFDFVQSESRSSVERLASMLAQNGYRTILVIGGDTALGDALNGIVQAVPDQLSEVALGVIPNGNSNDFATFWGIEEKNYQQTVDILIRRRLRKVDVGQCRYVHAGEAKTRYFLNCVNVGLVANILNIKRKTYRFWGMRWASYLASVFMMIFQRLDYRMHFVVNYEHVKGRVMSVCVGSAHGFGQTPSAVPYNGLLDVSILTQPELLQLIQGLLLLLTGRFLNYRKMRIHRTRKVDFEEVGSARISIDGRVMPSDIGMPLNITIHQEMINFIIP